MRDLLGFASIHSRCQMPKSSYEKQRQSLRIRHRRILSALEESTMNAIAIPLSRLWFTSRSSLAVRFPHFITLMKPRVMALAVFTAIVGLAIAPGHLDLLRAAISVIGIALGAG